jgi:hypothetical protein
MPPSVWPLTDAEKTAYALHASDTVFASQLEEQDKGHDYETITYNRRSRTTL